MMPFLYFPEDKTEYIPAALWLLLFFIGAIIAMRFIIHISKREQQKFEQQEQQKNEFLQKNQSNPKEL